MAAEEVKAESGVTRRQFIVSWVGLSWAAFIASVLAMLGTWLRYFYPRVLFEPPQTFKAGFPTDYGLGVDERWKNKHRVWIVRDEGGFYAIYAQCTHLGCTPNWLAMEQKFKCPCHGSGFYMSGINFEGPAPRPLERCKIWLAEDGQIAIDKSIRFRYEKGEWSKPEAYLPIPYTG